MDSAVKFIIKNYVQNVVVGKSVLLVAWYGVS